MILAQAPYTTPVFAWCPSLQEFGLSGKLALPCALPAARLQCNPQAKLRCRDSSRPLATKEQVNKGMPSFLDWLYNKCPKPWPVEQGRHGELVRKIGRCRNIECSTAACASSSFLVQATTKQHGIANHCPKLETLNPLHQ